MPFLACLGGRKLALEKNETLGGSGDCKNETAFGFQNQVARFLEASNGHESGIHVPSQLVIDSPV